jgi:DNA polymerase elongation subunit (family B)
MIIDYAIEGGKPVVHMWTRDKPGKKKHVKAIHAPYFYVSKPGGDEKGFFGEELRKIITTKPTDVGEQRIKYPESWESDVLFSDRYLIDCVPQIPEFHPKICYLDIEQSKFSLEGNEPIIIVGCKSSFDAPGDLDKVVSFVVSGNSKDEESLVGLINVRLYPDEARMLQGLADYIIKEDFDLFTGWNINGYDMPVILERMRKNKVNHNLLSPIGRTKIEIGNDKPISGRIVYDLQDGYKKAHKGTIPSTSLDYCAEIEGVGNKVHINWEESTLGEKAKYNKVDVVLPELIEHKRHIIAKKIYLQRKIGCRFEATYYNRNMIDIACLREAGKRGVRLPKTKSKKDQDARFKGGYVMRPKLGLYKNIVVFDISSMYPNIIIKNNMSPETKTMHIDDTQIAEFAPAPPLGLIPAVTQNFLKIANESKKKRNEATGEEKKILSDQYDTDKQLVNAMFGVNAYSNFRLYDLEVASSVTEKGRKIIRRLIFNVKKLGYEVVYSDTDSIFVAMEHEKAQEMLNTLNSLLKDDGMNIKIEKKYTGFLVTGAKRYAGLTEDGTLEITGLDAIRADSPKFVRSLLKIVLERTLKGDPELEVKKYIRDELERARDLDLTETAFPKTLTKDAEEYETELVQVKAAKKGNELLGKHYDKMSRFYVQYMGLRGTNPIGFDRHEEVKDMPFVFDKLEEHVRSKLEKIFEAVGWSVRLEGGTSSLLDF